MMRQVVEGLKYLHSHNILHRDMSLANLLLTKDMNIVSHASDLSAKFLIVFVLENRRLRLGYSTVPSR